METHFVSLSNALTNTAALDGVTGAQPAQAGRPVPQIPTSHGSVREKVVKSFPEPLDHRAELIFPDSMTLRQATSLSCRAMDTADIV